MRLALGAIVDFATAWQRVATKTGGYENASCLTNLRESSQHQYCHPPFCNQSVRIQSLDQFRVTAWQLCSSSILLADWPSRITCSSITIRISVMPTRSCQFLVRMWLFVPHVVPQETDKSRTISGSRSILRRSLGLIWLSAILTAFNSSFPSWNAMSGAAVLKFLAELLKANLWEVLAIIGAVQIGLLPIIGGRARVRIVALIALAITHTVFSWSFNESFVYGKPNWMDAYFGAAGKRAWDGGFFGLISWAEIMLSGTLAFDVMSQSTVSRAYKTLLILGVWFMLLGYGMSCLTRLYDRQDAVTAEPPPPQQQRLKTRWRRQMGWLDRRVADFSQIGSRPWTSLLAEPPFVPPPGVQQRAINYWMMDKRMVTQSFVFFGIGFAFCALWTVCCSLRCQPETVEPVQHLWTEHWQPI